jgi:hypothetical protein
LSVILGINLRDFLPGKLSLGSEEVEIGPEVPSRLSENSSVRSGEEHKGVSGPRKISAKQSRKIISKLTICLRVI